MHRSRIAPILIVAIGVAATARAAAAASYAYIPGGLGNVVSRLDLASNEAVPITVGQGPVGVDASADGGTVVVGNAGDGTVSVIDGATATVRWTVPVGASPRSVAVTPDGAKAFVVNRDDHTISVVDTVAGVVTKTIDVLGSMGGIAMSPDGQRAYVGNASFGGTVLVVDTAADIVVTETLVSDVSYAHSVVVSPDGTRVYVGLDSVLAVVDAATNLWVNAVGLPDGCCNPVVALAITPDGGTVYAGQIGGVGAVAIDSATLTASQLPSSSAFSSKAGVGVSPDGATLYVLNTGADTIDLIDTASGTLRSTLGALVSGPAASGDFIAGPTPPVVPPPPPLLSSAAQACQKAILDSFKTFAAKSHQLLSSCLLRVQKDRAVGAVTSGTTTACRRDLDTALATSRLAKARALAKQRISSGCAASSPAALGAPCDAGATTTDALADCALDRQLAGVSSAIDGEIVGACVLLDAVGLAAPFPALCP